MKRNYLVTLGGFLATGFTIVTLIFCRTTSLVASDKQITASETETTSKQQETINEDILPVSEEEVYEEPVTDIVYTTTSLNVRVAPDINSERVSILESNSELVRIEDNDNGWDAIEVAGIKYYVSDKYLTKTKPETIKKVTELKPIAAAAPPRSDQSRQVVQESGINGNYIGRFKLTAYCACSKCCGKWSGGGTASGTVPTQGRTVASNILPFGTRIVINGSVYIVEDTGNMADNVIDVFFSSHQEALNFGVQYAEVYYAD